MTKRLFAALDTDGNGVVDNNELIAGLSVLCAGSNDEKIRAAFMLYGECCDVQSIHAWMDEMDELSLHILGRFEVVWLLCDGQTRTATA